MVAYSFNRIFVPQVEGLIKRQTIRGHRKRHARRGEAVQLYTAMRTRYCRKLVEPDPVCTRLDEIRMEVGDRRAVPDAPPGVVEDIEINGIALAEPELEEFAVADGFGPLWHAPPGHVFKGWVTARLLMGTYWRFVHGPGAFQGVVVHWSGRAPDRCQGSNRERARLGCAPRQASPRREASV